MLQDWDLNEVSDGKKYKSSDMVRISCNDCAGCSYCCHEVDNSIVLDPYDMYMLEVGVKLKVDQLFGKYLELRLVDGLILPNMKIDQEKGCPFLSEEGRCTIHDYRTGFCRLYPLARVYEDGDFYYTHLINQWRSRGPLSKIKISKWLGVDNLRQYEQFILDWHYFLKQFQDLIMAGQCGEDEQKRIVNSILNTFYLTPYEERDFYTQISERFDRVTL